MPDPPPPPRPAGSGGMMSGLYANLLQSSSAAAATSSSSATVSAAPIVFSQQANEAAEPSKPSVSASALRFQPVIHKRPVPSTANKPKPRPVGAAGAAPHPPKPVDAPKIASKTKLDDWMDDGNDDVNGFYSKQSGGGGGRKKKRKKNRGDERVPTNWDDPYDPLRPNSYEEYKEGEEKVREMAEWRERLYGRSQGRRGSSASTESSDDDRARGLGARFAPPSSYSFAPPPSLAPPSATSTNAPPPPPPPPSEIPDDISGEDAFARRMRMSQQGAVGYSSFAPPQTYNPTPTPPPPPPPTTTAPSATISAAPVRYNNVPPPPPPSAPEEPQEQQEQQQSSSTLPGQSGFARRLMESQGWVAGSGLGRSGGGITQPLSLVAAKGKNSKAGFGKIVDKNRREKREGEDDEKSEVVEVTGVINGWKGEMEDSELMQSIGEVFGKFGRVVQTLIRWDEGKEKEGEDEDGGKAKVYVVFAEEMSAGMAVSAFRKGMEGKDPRRREVFEGNETAVRYFPRERWEKREF